VIKPIANKNFLSCLAVVFFAYNSFAIASQPYHPHDDIQATVQSFLDTQLNTLPDVKIKTQINSLDTRLKLSFCHQPLKAFVNNNRQFQSRLSVGIKCEGKKPWSLYVPVKIQRFANVFISAHSIAKGDRIGDTDIQAVSRDITRLRGQYLKTRQNIVGKIAKRSIRLGSTFKPNALALPIVVKKGDLVNILAETPGLSIRMTGKAINAGAKGQQIRVKNLSSNRIIQAIVQKAGLVKIRL